MTTWQDVLQPGRARSFFDRDPFPRFDPTAAGYSAENAWWLAELSRLVYRHDVEEDPLPLQPTRGRFLAQAGLRQIRFFSSADTGTQALLVRSDGVASFGALVFRGTEQRIQDVLRDLEFVPVGLVGDSVRVHEGFTTALDSVWGDMARELDALDCPVFYTGHSLGAALATLAAARRPPRALYTFGSPRVGNDAFVATLKDVPAFRIVDDRDVVTTVPPEAIGFRHVGELRRLLAPARPRLSWDPRAWFSRLSGPPRQLADHAPINYVERIG